MRDSGVRGAMRWGRFAAEIAGQARRHGTPLVVYSEAELTANFKRLRGALPEGASLAYSIKANPNPSLLRVLLGLGAVAEAASHGELALALRQGTRPDALFLGGPAKSVEAITLAVDRSVGAVLVESEAELERVRAVAERLGKPVDVLLRVNPAGLTSRSVLRMSGLGTAFGIEEGRLFGFLTRDHPLVRIAGLFLYAGSQHLAAEDVVANSRHLAALALRLVREGAPPPRVLDFGGGFGVPVTDDDPALDLDALRDGLRGLFEGEVAELRRAGLRQAVFESGRYLVASAATYVTRVVDLKHVHGRRYAMLDGGINHIGVLQLPYRKFEPRVEVNGRQGEPDDGEPVTLVGPTCTPIDIVHQGCVLPPLRPDDLILIPCFGAYSVSFSPVHLCGHPWPAEILVRADGSARLVRRRGRVEEACGVGYEDGVEPLGS